MATYDDVLVSLVAEVATTYLQLRILQERLAVAQANVVIQARSVARAFQMPRHSATPAQNGGKDDGHVSLRHDRHQVSKSEFRGDVPSDAQNVVTDRSWLLPLLPILAGAARSEKKCNRVRQTSSAHFRVGSDLHNIPNQSYFDCS